MFNQYALTRFYLGFNDFCSARYFSNLDEIREKVSATINHGIPSLFWNELSITIGNLFKRFGMHKGMIGTQDSAQEWIKFHDNQF